LMSSQYVRTPDELDVYKRIRRFTSTSEYVAYVDEFSIRETSRRIGSSTSEYVAYVEEFSRREVNAADQSITIIRCTGRLLHCFLLIDEHPRGRGWKGRVAEL
jgi:hypothetical protein